MTPPPRVHRVAVVGSAGFLGRHVLAACREAGLETCGWDAQEIPHEEARRDAARRHLSARPDVVVHAAGAAADSPLEELKLAHVVSTAELLEDVARLAPSARVLVLGSAAELGPPLPRGLAPEQEGGSPTGPYGRSKLEQSIVARELGRRHGLDVVRLRLFNTLGPGQGARLVGGALVARLREVVRRGASDLPVAEPESVRDFLDARDVARLLLGIARRLPKEPERPPVNICSGQGTSVAALAGELLAAAGARVILQFEPLARPPTRVVGACPTLRALLGDESVRHIETLESLRDMWRAAGGGGPS